MDRSASISTVTSIGFTIGASKSFQMNKKASEPLCLGRELDRWQCGRLWRLLWGHKLLSWFSYEHQVKALVSVGCCYNLLSEDCCGDTNSCPGFPMSKAAKRSYLMLGKSIRDLACQSAERWRSLTKDAARQNFDTHAFRAALQMVLENFFPEISKLSPSIGRQGKALRRQRLQKVVESHIKKTDSFSCRTLKDQNLDADGVDTSIYGADTRPDYIHHDEHHKFSLFRDYTVSGFSLLGCGSVEDASLLEIWKDVQPFAEYIGPFWCLRAALGPVVETYILLDRLRFLQEQGDVAEAFLFPLFDPTLSPRNMAIIAWKLSAEA